MFRRIGRFFKDINETIKRERGKLQINSDSVAFPFKSLSLSSSDQEVQVKDSRTLQRMFISMDINDDIPEINVKGESDYSHPPGISSQTTNFSITLNQMIHNDFDESIKDGSCEFRKITSLKQLEIDTFLEPELRKTSFEKLQQFITSIKKPVQLGDISLSIQAKDFSLSKFNVCNSQMKTNTIVNDLETEFDQKQHDAFHYENSTVFNTMIETYTLPPKVKFNQSLACVMKFPIKRMRVSKSGYEREELKRALSFIVNRYKSNSRLSIVGIYKNVPVDTAERLTFSKKSELYFFLKKGTQRRSILIDVLVVKTKEGRYHVGPIVRKA
ncbi:MAG: hypothetical protein ACLFQE_01660 [Thermotogota bacterium]